MKFRAKWLDVPGLSQGNEKNQQASQTWCGRASAAMIYNYFQKVAGASDSALIENKQGLLPPYNLVYADGGVVGQTAASSTGFDLHSVLEKAVAGWERVQLYPVASRATVAPGEDEIRVLLARVIESLEANNPILFASGISRGHVLANGTIAQTRHLVVICGYRVKDEALWLLIKDPATMIEGTAAHPQKVRLLQAQNVEVLDPGTWYTKAAHYWLRAARLFQKNERSTDPSDLWCDHSDFKGFTVEINAKAKTAESPYSHAETGFAFPLSIRGRPAGVALQPHRGPRGADRAHRRRRAAGHGAQPEPLTAASASGRSALTRYACTRRSLHHGARSARAARGARASTESGPGPPMKSASRPAR